MQFKVPCKQLSDGENLRLMQIKTLQNCKLAVKMIKGYINNNKTIKLISTINLVS